MCTRCAFSSQTELVLVIVFLSVTVGCFSDSHFSFVQFLVVSFLKYLFFPPGVVSFLSWHVPFSELLEL